MSLNKKKLYGNLGGLALLVVAIYAFKRALSGSPGFLDFYVRRVFVPFQNFRGHMLNAFAFSIGDVLYLVLGLGALVWAGRLLFLAFTYKRHRGKLSYALLRSCQLGLLVYLLFLLSWGGNYERRPLVETWGLQERPWGTALLWQLAGEMVRNMNEIQEADISYKGLAHVNQVANGLYAGYGGNPISTLKVKPTGLGQGLSYLGIQGYYNPITGEAQFNKGLPRFMYPFVVSHEMAHQIGIAAEDEANLMAYVLGASSQDISFRYSAYFNLFVYAYADLRGKDSLLAKELFGTLNERSQRDWQELRDMNKKYRSPFRSLSNDLYDRYLKWHGQKQGIHTYGDVTKWAYYWEHEIKRSGADLTIYP